MKTISELYHGAHNTTAADQHKRYGNPITTAPAHVPGVLQQAVRDRLITDEQARKLATQLGRKSYGEWGLSSGVVDCTMDRVLAGHEIHWRDKMQLSAAISQR